MRRLWTLPPKAVAFLMLLSTALLAAGTANAAVNAPAHPRAAATFSTKLFASAAHLMHAAPKGQEAVSKPDDITSLGHHLFVGFQNGVGPQGEASTTGNLDSTVVEFNSWGHAVAQWDIVGKCDGLTADPYTGQIIATVNEDANSSVYLIDPDGGSKPAGYQFNEPLPSKGGTDAISVYRGTVLISASAPGTTGAAAPQAAYPAVYRVVFDAKTHVATVTSLFSDEATATVANTGAGNGKAQKLALTDPDSNEVVPHFAARFAGDFMLTSQGDKEQIFVHGAGWHDETLSVLTLSDSVDDTAWPSGRWGAIYATDSATDTTYKVTGHFRTGSVIVVDTPCGANNAPSSCPAPGFPANYLGQLNPWTGAITRVALTGPAFTPQGGLLFL
jgi:hypothetical protein